MQIFPLNDFGMIILNLSINKVGIQNMKIGIIDYGAGNIGSVMQAFKAAGSELERVSDADKLKDYDKVVLPGVGAFGNAIDHLRSSCLDEAILDFTKSGKCFFGVCVGMQLLFEEGLEFGKHQGLGIFKGTVKRFDEKKLQPLKIPHIGWNQCKKKKDSPLLRDFEDDFYLYFVHSFHAVIEKSDEDCVVASCVYGYEFPAIIQKENIFGIQPHPEKSDKNGLRILENFLKI